MPNQSDLNGRVPPHDHAEGQDNQPAPKPASENQSTDDATHPATPPSTPLPRPIMPATYELLNARIEEDLLGADVNQQQRLLTEIGGGLRRWRIQSGYTRDVGDEA